jgi:hypothetical protein
MIDPGIATIRARAAAYTMHAMHDPKETTVKARATFNARFIEMVDPLRLLPEAERLRRTECARRAYFSSLALRSAMARRAKGTRQGQTGRPVEQ